LKNKIKCTDDKLNSHVESKNEIFSKMKKENKIITKSIIVAKESISLKLDQHFNTLKLCTDKMNNHCNIQIDKNITLEKTLKQKMNEFLKL